MQESSKEYIMYESFDELPKEFKEKFKSGAKGWNLKQAKDGYVDFINLLSHQGDELAGDYVGSKVKMQVKFSRCGHVADISPNDYKRGVCCGVCHGRQIQQGVNDIATTYPQFIKYFANINDTHTHTYSSGKKVELKCPDCGHTKMMTVGNLTHQGFSCDICSDGYPFPEKLMASVLTKLNIGFTRQMSYDNGENKYDFYLPQYNVILETHGLQHYEHGFKKFGKTLEEEQENDKHKREVAIENGILNNNYHEIDCRYSTLEYCRPNIEQVLSNYIDMSTLTDEEWKHSDIQAQKSLKIEICKYWEENKRLDSELTTTQVADVFEVVDSTVREYLKWGSTSGFCGYDAQEEKGGSIRRNSTFVYLVKPNGDKWFDESMSLREMERQTGITRSTIKNSLDKGALKYNNRAKYDPKYIGSRIVSVEVYDNQTQANQNTYT